jgi:hypothetical protein
MRTLFQRSSLITCVDTNAESRCDAAARVMSVCALAKGAEPEYPALGLSAVVQQSCWWLHRSLSLLFVV